jgi:hypothetical protein
MIRVGFSPEANPVNLALNVLRIDDCVPPTATASPNSWANVKVVMPMEISLTYNVAPAAMKGQAIPDPAPMPINVSAGTHVASAVSYFIVARRPAPAVTRVAAPN